APLNPGATAWEAVQEHLHGRNLLLVLDNCEHLIDDAADFIQQTLNHAATLTILATSRQSLGVIGEQTIRIPSLALPPAEEGSLAKLRNFDSVALFLNRAALAQNGFRLTEENASDDALGLAAGLSEKSLLVYGAKTGRYQLQETVRAYARELLAASAEEHVYRLRHLRHMVELAEAAEPKLLSGEAKDWLERIK